MNIKEFPDGTVFTGKHLLATIGMSAALAVVIVPVVMKIDTWKTKRIMKKNGWPQKAIDRI